MNKNYFKIGDLIQHKRTGEIFTVVDILFYDKNKPVQFKCKNRKGEDVNNLRFRDVKQVDYVKLIKSLYISSFLLKRFKEYNVWTDTNGNYLVSIKQSHPNENKTI